MRRHFLVIPAFVLQVAACAGDAEPGADSTADPVANTVARDTAAAPAADGVTAGTPADAGCMPGPIADTAAGPVALGMTVDQVRARCPGTRDTTARADEGQLARTLTVPLGADTVVASIVDGRVWRLAVTTPGLRTRDSLGVGTPLARLLALPGARGITGEGRTFVIAEAPCGLSFQLSNGVKGAAADTATLRRLPGGTKVSRVLVTGCGG